MLRPLSLARSYNEGVTGAHQLAQSDSQYGYNQLSNSTNSLTNILANASIQGLTDEHIAKLLSPSIQVGPQQVVNNVGEVNAQNGNQFGCSINQLLPIAEH